jgi:hypothetical protein
MLLEARASTYPSDAAVKGAVGSGLEPKPIAGRHLMSVVDGDTHDEEPDSEDVANKDITELLKDLTQGITTLVRQEIQLIKAELAEKTDAVRDEVQDTITEARLELEVAKTELADAGRKAGVGAGLFGTAGLLGLGAFGTFTACLVALLAQAMPAWLSALLVTLLYGAVGGALALAGRKQVKKVDFPVP